ALPVAEAPACPSLARADQRDTRRARRQPDSPAALAKLSGCTSGDGVPRGYSHRDGTSGTPALRSRTLDTDTRELRSLVGEVVPTPPHEHVEVEGRHGEDRPVATPWREQRDPQPLVAVLAPHQPRRDPVCAAHLGEQDGDRREG